MPFEALGATDLPLPLVRTLAVIQPLVLIVLAVLLGLWAAPRVGLDAPVIRAIAEARPWRPALRQAMTPALAAGLFVAGLLLVYRLWSAALFANVADPIARFEAPLITKLLYGGIGEELLTRWGLMSLFVWCAWQLARTASPTALAYWTGASLAAALFAAGHLPMLFLLLPSAPPVVVGAVLVGNFAPGLLFGWLFWRHGLEAAMIAHAAAHLLSTLALHAGILSPQL